MSHFKPDRRAATPQAQTEQRAAELDAARRTAARSRPATSNRSRARGLVAGLRTGTVAAHAAAADADRAVPAASAAAPAHGGRVSGPGARHRRAPGPAAATPTRHRPAHLGAPGGRGPPASRPLRGAPSARHPTAAARCHRYHDGRCPPRPPRRRDRCADGTAATSYTIAHDAGSTATSPPSSRSCATTTRRSGGRSWHGNGNTSSANASGGGGSASAPRLPAPGSSRAGPPSRHRRPQSAAPHPARRLRTPCGTSTRALPGPGEPADATFAPSGRAGGRRPRPRAGPELEAVGPTPCQGPLATLAGADDRDPVRSDPPTSESDERCSPAIRFPGRQSDGCPVGLTPPAAMEGPRRHLVASDAHCLINRAVTGRRVDWSWLSGARKRA